jgi:hypothetical protein
VNVALVAPDGTVTDEGTVKADVLLERLIARPFFGAAMSVVTVQVSVPAPVTEPLAQVRVESEAVVAPLPWSLTAVDRVVDVLLFAFTLNWPVESVTFFGLK